MTTTTRPACTRCGLYEDALIHNATANGHNFATDYNCPPWCERDDHHADVVGPGYPPAHYGPQYGAVWTQQIDDRYMAAVMADDDTLYYSDPNELRTVAADMIRAAEWIEGQR